MFGAIAGAIGGNLLGAGLDYFSAKQQNDMAQTNARDAERFSGAQSAQQMAFQERMSNTSHQREVSDLKAAGLNPLLSLNSGASTPSGAMGSGVNAPVVPELGALVSSAREGRMWSANLKNIEYDSFNKDLEGQGLKERNKSLKLSNEIDDMRNDIYRKHPRLLFMKEMAGSVSSAVAATAAAAAAGKSLMKPKVQPGPFGQGLRR